MAQLNTSVPTGAPVLRARSRAQRDMLANWLIAQAAGDNPKLDYNRVRPPGSRGFDPTWSEEGSAGTWEKYYSYQSMLNKYDIFLSNGVPLITDNTQLPAGHQFDETAETALRKEMLKLHWLFAGTVHKTVAEKFVPQEIRVEPKNVRYWEYVNTLVKVGHACRNAIVNDKMIPLVVSWVSGNAWRNLPSVDTVQQRIPFFSARVDEDPSIPAWVLTPFNGTLNLRYYYQPHPPTNPVERQEWERARKYLRAKIIWWADIVYCGLIDHVPNSSGTFKQFNAATTAALKSVDAIDVVAQWVVRVEKFGSYEIFRK